MLSFITFPPLTGDLPIIKWMYRARSRYVTTGRFGSGRSPGPWCVHTAVRRPPLKGDLRNSVAGPYGDALISVSQPWVGLTQSFDPRPPSA